jgi:hypothetical protein
MGIYPTGSAAFLGCAEAGVDTFSLGVTAVEGGATRLMHPCYGSMALTATPREDGVLNFAFCDGKLP